MLAAALATVTAAIGERFVALDDLSMIFIVAVVLVAARTRMTGAGTLIAAKYLHSSAKPDGLSFGIFNGALILSGALGNKSIDFDMTMISGLNPSRAKKPSLAPRCIGQAAKPGEDGAMRTRS